MQVIPFNVLLLGSEGNKDSVVLLVGLTCYVSASECSTLLSVNLMLKDILCIFHTHTMPSP